MQGRMGRAVGRLVCHTVDGIEVMARSVDSGRRAHWVVGHAVLTRFGGPEVSDGPRGCQSLRQCRPRTRSQPSPNWNATTNPRAANSSSPLAHPEYVATQSV